MSSLNVKIQASHRKTRARVLQLSTAHGEVETPVFMPVGTRAGVNNITPTELIDMGSQLILGGNTMHMLCSPGMEIMEAAGGMHAWMGWQGPMLTDSGGFQIFSLSKNKNFCYLDESGAYFRRSLTAPFFHMTPTVSLATQKIIGADIIMAFDQCTPADVTHTEAANMMHRTHRWLEESVVYHQAHPTSRYGWRQALFGIVQGGLFDDLRRESVDFILNQPLDGIALGGEAIGFNMPKTVEIIQSVVNHLPDLVPRYTMGVGMSPQDLLDVIEQGIDMFDCVAPTRNARHGALYCGQIVPSGDWLRFESAFDQGRLQIKKAVFATDEQPIMPGCDCYTCQHHSRAYLHQLFKVHAVAFTALASIHNVHVMHTTCTIARNKIKGEAHA